MHEVTSLNNTIGMPDMIRKQIGEYIEQRGWQDYNIMVFKEVIEDTRQVIWSCAPDWLFLMIMQGKTNVN